MHKSSVSTSVVKNIWQFPSVSSLAHFLWVSTYYKYIPINLEVFLNCRGSMALTHKYSSKFKTSSSDTCWWWLTNFHSKLHPDVWRILRQPLFRDLIRSHFWTKLKWVVCQNELILLCSLRSFGMKFLTSCWKTKMCF